jgi:hypothetical protein
VIPRTERVRAFAATRFFDLEFDSIGEAEAFLRTMQRVWGGPGKAIMQNPSGRVADIVEVKEL